MRLGNGVRAIGAWLVEQLEELIVVVGLGLVTVGLWPIAGRVALVVPGLVLLWLALPQRVPFIAPKPPARPPSKGGA